MRTKCNNGSAQGSSLTKERRKHAQQLRPLALEIWERAGALHGCVHVHNILSMSIAREDAVAQAGPLQASSYCWPALPRCCTTSSRSRVSPTSPVDPVHSVSLTRAMASTRLPFMASLNCLPNQLSCSCAEHAKMAINAHSQDSE